MLHLPHLLPNLERNACARFRVPKNKGAQQTWIIPASLQFAANGFLTYNRIAGSQNIFRYHEEK
jgi:hypothetical protein